MTERETSFEPVLQPEFSVEMIRLSRDMYPEGTLCYQYFPEILEGRMRPATYADVRFSFGPKTMEYLADQGLHTLANLLRVPEDQLDSMPRQFQPWIKKGFARRMERLIERQALTPHGRVI